MSVAQRIREFLETLFTSRLVVELRAELAEARKDRDYFRGRAERLELIMQTPRQQRVTLDVPSPERKHRTGTVGGFKSWNQVQREHKQKIDEQVKAEALKKQAESIAAN